MSRIPKEEERADHAISRGHLRMPEQIGDDVRGAYAALERLYASWQAKGRQPDENLCPKGCVNGWIVYDKGDEVWAEPCPDHKPKERQAYERGELTNRYFNSRDKGLSNEEKRKRNLARAKKKHNL